MFLPVTLTLAAVCALVNIWLQLRVGSVRARQRISVGDGGDPVLLRRMRAQANFLENAAFALILIGAIELAVGQSPLLWIAGLVFVLARIAHAFGMEGGRLQPARLIGMLGTVAVLLGLAGYALYLVSAAPHPMRAPSSIGDVARAA